MTVVYPQLNQAPITEALLDIRVERSEAVSLERLQAFTQKVQAVFPEQRQIKTIEAHFPEPNTADVPVRRDEINGFIHWNTDKTRAVQARLDGFSVNHVREKYTQWAALRDEARGLWEEYLRIVAPKSMVRCALRYINRLEVSSATNIPDVLKTRIEIASTLPQQNAGFLFKTQIPFDENRQAIITQASAPNLIDSTKLFIIFDIDVFSNKALSIGDESVWEEFSILREIKNRCFFESLQEKTVEVYK